MLSEYKHTEELPMNELQAVRKTIQLVKKGFPQANFSQVLEMAIGIADELQEIAVEQVKPLAIKHQLVLEGAETTFEKLKELGYRFESYTVENGNGLEWTTTMLSIHNDELLNGKILTFMPTEDTLAITVGSLNLEKIKEKGVTATDLINKLMNLGDESEVAATEED